MFSKSVALVFLGLSVSSSLAAPTAKSNDATCDASASAVVVTKTVTVTQAAAATASAVADVSTSSSTGESTTSSSGKSTTSSSGKSTTSSSGKSKSSSSGKSSSSSSSSSATSTNDSSTGTAAVSTNNGSTGTAAVSTDNGSTGAAATSSGATTTESSSVGVLSTTDVTTNATADSTDPQSSLLLDSRVIATGFMQNGQNVAEAGQVASLTSNNNFINYCLTQNVPITNGLQILTGSCNPAPIGTIPAVTKMPSSKFSNPANGATIAANTDFTITMNVNNLITGNFVNADESYFAAPQQVDSSTGFVIGHTHVVMELLTDLAQTKPTNPQVFAFFKGVDTAAVNGAVTVDVTAGVPDGAYRLCSINSSANHQPIIAPVAQHGALDDCVYFTASGNAAANSTAQAAAASDSQNPAAGAAAAAVSAFGATGTAR